MEKSAGPLFVVDKPGPGAAASEQEHKHLGDIFTSTVGESVGQSLSQAATTNTQASSMLPSQEVSDNILLFLTV